MKSFKELTGLEKFLTIAFFPVFYLSIPGLVFYKIWVVPEYTCSQRVMMTVFTAVCLVVFFFAMVAVDRGDEI